MQRQTGWEMKFLVDLTGRVSGQNRNDVAGAEMKTYSGAVCNGIMKVVATFESGATIEYHGTITAALTFQGLCIVTSVPAASAASFKPIGTTGTLGGSVMVLFSKGADDGTDKGEADGVADIADAELQRVYYTVPEFATGWSAENQQAIQESKRSERASLMELFNAKKATLLASFMAEQEAEGGMEGSMDGKLDGGDCLAEEDETVEKVPLPVELGWLAGELADEVCTAENLAADEADEAVELAAALEKAGDDEAAAAAAQAAAKDKRQLKANLRAKRAARLAELAAAAAGGEAAWLARLAACEDDGARAKLVSEHEAEVAAGLEQVAAESGTSREKLAERLATLQQ